MIARMKEGTKRAAVLMCQAQCPGSLIEQSGQSKGHSQQARVQNKTPILCDMSSNDCPFVLDLCRKDKLRPVTKVTNEINKAGSLKAQMNTMFNKYLIN